MVIKLLMIQIQKSESAFASRVLLISSLIFISLFSRIHFLIQNMPKSVQECLGVFAQKRASTTDLEKMRRSLSVAEGSDWGMIFPSTAGATGVEQRQQV